MTQPTDYAKNKKKKAKKDKHIEKPYFGITQFNPATKVFLNKNSKIYDHTVTYERNEGVYYTKEYSLYEGSIGAGNQTILIKTEQKISLGDNLLFLKPLTKEEVEQMLWTMKNNFLHHELCKKLWIKTIKGEGQQRERRSKEEIINDILKLDYVFYTLTLPVPRTELEKVDNFLELTTDLLQKGTTQISPQLTYTTVSHIPEVDPEHIKPNTYMPYADHEMVITEGGEGKTTLTEHITAEPNTTEATMPNMLGSSDGKNKWEGSLHNRTKMLCLDENQDRIEEDVLGQLHNYMETGSCIRGKGVGIRVEGYASIRFLGNAKPTAEEQDTPSQEGQQDLLRFRKFLAIKRFRDFLVKLSRNVFPFSRRVATTQFNLTMVKIVGEGVSQEEKEKSIAIIRTIAEGFRKEFTELYFKKDIKEWLSKPFDEPYTKHLKSLAQECNDNIVKEYTLGRVECFRHMRGQALKLAWLEVGLGYFIKNNKYDTKTILKSAEDHLSKLKDINLNSIQTIVSLTKEDLYQQIELYKLKGLKPKYVKLAIYTLLEYLSQTQKQETIIPLSLMEDCYETAKELLGTPPNDTYRSFYEVKRKIQTNQNQIKVTLEDLGLEYDNPNESFIITSKTKIDKILEVYQNDADYKNYKKEKQEEKNKTTKTTKTTTNSSVVSVVCSLEKKSLIALSHKRTDGECSSCGKIKDLWFTLPNQKTTNDMNFLICESCKNKLVKQGYTIQEAT